MNITRTPIYAIALALILIATSCSGTKKMEASNKEKESIKKTLATCTAEKATLTSDLAKCKTDLASKSKELTGLKKVVTDEQAKINKMKKELLAAFSGYDKNQVKIDDRDGRLVVVMQNKILYQSGKVAINESGQQAITTMAQVFKNNKGLNILIESHTDDQAISNVKYKDNWDLSVARSVTVVRMLEGQGVNPTRMTAAGRGEFVPVSQVSTDDETSRAANRRTEFIISPKMAGIYKLLNEL